METSHRVLYIYHGYFLFQSVMQYPCCHLTYFSKNSIARPKVYTTEKQVVARLVRNDQTIHMIVFINLYTIITQTRRINKNVNISYFNHFIKNTTILNIRDISRQLNKKIYTQDKRNISNSNSYLSILCIL